MSDAKWAVVRDAMPVPPWLEDRDGHRQVVESVLSALRICRP
ncbi:hypothetical protein ACIQVL_34895 [Streptomyces sp. NPDC090499]